MTETGATPGAVTTRSYLARRATSGVIWLGIQSIAGRIATFLSQVVLASLLAPQDFGMIALASTITTIASVLVGFGVDDVLLQRHKSIRLWEGAAFWTSLAFGIAGAVVVVVAAPIGVVVYRSPQLIWILPLLALAMPLNALGTVPIVRIRARLDFRLLALFGGGEAIATALLTVLFAWAGLGVYSFVVPAPTIALGRTVLLWRLAGAPTMRLSRHTASKQWRILLGKSSAVFGSKAVSSIVSQADYAVLGLVASGETVGIYYFAFRLAVQPLRVLAGNVTGVLFPTLTQLNGQPEKQREIALRAAHILAFAAMPVCFLQAALAEPIFSLFFNASWRPSIPVMQLLSFGLPFDAVAWVAGSYLTATGQFQRDFLYSVYGTIVFIGLVCLGAFFGQAIGTAFVVAVYYIISGPAFTLATFGASRTVATRLIEFFGIAPAISALSFGGALLASIAIVPEHDAALQAVTECAIGVPTYLALLYATQPSLFAILRSRVATLLTKSPLHLHSVARSRPVFSRQGRERFGGGAGGVADATYPLDIFRAEFIDKRLTRYDECRTHYRTFGLSQIIAEVRFLINEPVASIPFALTGRRFCALMSWAIDYTADRRGLDATTRSKLVRLCVDMIAVARREIHPEDRNALEDAIQDSLGSIERFGLCPKVALLIEQEVRDYEGEFDESPVGIALAKEGYPPA